MKFLNVMLSALPRVIPGACARLTGMTGNLAVLSVATLLLASCSVYDNYDIDLMQDATASIESSSSKGESQGNENDGEKSSSSGETSGASSSSVKKDDLSSSSKKDTTYVVIVNPSSSSQKVESAGSSAVDNPGSSSSKPPEESSSSEAGFPCGDSTMTRGGVEYETVKIGKLCWTAENLRYKDAIPEKNYTCSLSDDSDCATYGLMYNFAGAKEVCPDGWRLPTKTDLDNLHDYLKKATSELAGNWLKSLTGWNGEPGNGSNKSKFNGLPAGICDEDAECAMVGNAGYWWTSEESSMDFRYVLLLKGNSDEWFNNEELDEIYYASVRCVRE